MSHLPAPLYGFAIFFFIFWCGTWCLHLLAICYGKFKLHKKSSTFLNETPLPGVSILKPLMGVDPNLEHNLQTFFTMDYPVGYLLRGDVQLSVAEFGKARNCDRCGKIA
uniref:Uncharacterized protein n=1 Tax=Glossina palpalis gambiensis TaxID=67801 RepID=A0A1B0BZH6_9MUSC